MAAFNRPTVASYEVHETVCADTRDNEDHTFCGIMFPVKAKSVLPVEKIIIHSVSVRGQLGDLTVWVSDLIDPGDGDNGRVYSFRLSRRRWTKVYEQSHKPSQQSYDMLDFSQNPIVLVPGQVRAIYIHSSLPGDQAIVYDHSLFQNNRRNPNPRYEDNCIAIYTGKAHVSTTPFGNTPIWGWGSAWRDRREFVGQVRYGTVYKLWNPDRHISFGPNFRRATRTTLILQRRDESPFSLLPDECIYYIMNMCRWDWFDDCPTKMKIEKRIRARSARENLERNAIGVTQAEATTGSTQGNFNGSNASMSTNETSDAIQPNRITQSDIIMGNEDEDNDSEENIHDDEDDNATDGLNDAVGIEEDADTSDASYDEGRRDQTFDFPYHDLTSDDENEEDDDHRSTPVRQVQPRHFFVNPHFFRVQLLRAFAQNHA